MPRVLFVDDDPTACDTLGHYLRRAGFEVVTALSSLEGLNLARMAAPDVIVLDDRFPDGPTGRDVLRMLRDEQHAAPVIMISGFGTAETGFEAARFGAVDYLSKPVFGDDLVKAVTLAVNLRPPSSRRRDSAAAGNGVTEPRDAASVLLGSSSSMRAVRRRIRLVARGGGNVLIEGETGTGKELVARAIHSCSPRARGTFAPVNCGALPQSLLESELFGHARGAFTGADAAREGLFETAHQGTLFLDEISTLPLPLQPALLRVLDSGEVRRLGESKVRRVDARIVAATNVSLAEASQAGEFRRDLLFRLNEFRIPLPPLRERGDDILLLAEHFLLARAGPNAMLGLDARHALLSHAWPGNVRELRHAIHHATVYADGGVIRIAHLPDYVTSGIHTGQKHAALSPTSIETKVAQEKAWIVSALRKSEGKIGDAAKDLGLSRTGFWRLMRKHNVRPQW